MQDFACAPDQQIFDNMVPKRDQPSPTMPTADQLAYIADMIAELQGMAQQADLETLAAILTAAVVEANRQAKISR